MSETQTPKDPRRVWPVVRLGLAVLAIVLLGFHAGIVPALSLAMAYGGVSMLSMIHDELHYTRIVTAMAAESQHRALMHQMAASEELVRAMRMAHQSNANAGGPLVS